MDLMLNLFFLLVTFDFSSGQIDKWPTYTVEETKCPRKGDPFVAIPPVPWGAHDRAWLTIPKEIEVRKSTIPNAGLGTFTRTFLRPNTWLGEYDGEIFVDDDHTTAYAWVIARNSSFVYHIDAARITTSNWLRWVNCPRTAKEENVKGVTCYGHIMYVVSKPVAPGQELFVYYGDDYARYLGIDPKEFADPQNDHAESSFEADTRNNCLCPCPCK